MTGQKTIDLVRRDALRRVDQAIAIVDRLVAVTGRPSALRPRLVQHKEYWTETTPQVAVIGASSAGKTTLLRMLLPVAFLPTGRTTTTAAITTLRFGPQAMAQVRLHDRVYVTAHPPGRDQADPASMKALHAWAEDPGYRITEVVETSSGTRTVTDRQGLVQRLAAGIAPGTVIEVGFRPSQPVSFDLTDPAPTARFGEFLQNPVLALRVAHATCFLPHERLRRLCLIDTAGFSSATQAHADVSGQLLARRPDTILLLLDARKLDSVASHDAIASLQPVVQHPSDYSDLIVGLTHWDRALYSHIDDRDRGEDYHHEPDRTRLTESFLAAKREELHAILTDQLALAPPGPLIVHPLALTERAPADLRQHLDLLWRDIEHHAVSTGDDTRVWTARLKTGVPAFQSLKTECQLEADAAKRQTAADSASGDDIRQRIRGNIARYKNLLEVSERVKNTVRSAPAAQQARLLAEIDNLATAKQFREYVQQRYAARVNAAMDAIDAVARAQYESLAPLLPAETLAAPVMLAPGWVLPNADINRHFQRRVSGKGHVLKKGWSLAIGSTIGLDLAARDLRAAKEALKHHVGWAVIYRVGGYLEYWIAHIDGIRATTVDIMQQEYQRLTQDDATLRSSAQASAAKVEQLRRVLDHATDILQAVLDDIDRGHR